MSERLRHLHSGCTRCRQQFCVCGTKFDIVVNPRVPKNCIGFVRADGSLAGAITGLAAPAPRETVAGGTEK